MIAVDKIGLFFRNHNRFQSSKDRRNVGSPPTIPSILSQPSIGGQGDFSRGRVLQHISPLPNGFLKFHKLDRLRSKFCRVAANLREGVCRGRRPRPFVWKELFLVRFESPPGWSFGWCSRSVRRISFLRYIWKRVEVTAVWTVDIDWTYLRSRGERQQSNSPSFFEWKCSIE
jgi:hypothetical protein